MIRDPHQTGTAVAWAMVLSWSIGCLPPNGSGPPDGNHNGSEPDVQSVTVTPVKDNTIFSLNQSNSNALGTLFCGMNNEGNMRRSLLSFDVVDAVPPGSTVLSVTLTLNLEQASPGSGSQNQQLHRLTQAWGEGTSTSGSGRGVPATTGDVTWLHTFYPDREWTVPGGDFEPSPSAAVVVGSELGPYTWGPTAQMIQDVQDWLEHPDRNFGWILLGNEETPRTVRKYTNREEENPELWPQLIIEFDPSGEAGRTVD